MTVIKASKGKKSRIYYTVVVDGVPVLGPTGMKAAMAHCERNSLQLEPSYQAVYGNHRPSYYWRTGTNA